MTDNVTALKKQLAKLSNPKKAKLLQSFFKTGPGEYGEGDIFVGVTVPNIRAVARKNLLGVSVSGCVQLLRSKVHEERLLAVILLVEKSKRAAERERLLIRKKYLENSHYVNNWDLVDLSAPDIVGRTISGKEYGLLYRLARSPHLWTRRISIVASFALIRTHEFEPTLTIARAFLGDTEDLIHKATGWMLREVGKRDKDVLVGFLRQHSAHMPRTMLRYAIERFPQKERQKYLKTGRKR